MKRLIGCALLALSLSLAGCGEDPVPEQGKDASVVITDAGTCAVTCAGACCADGQSCYQDACCTPACDGKECGDDGCGGSCGSCAGTEQCGAAGQCEPKCVPETNEAFCDRLQKECGSVTAPDNCGQSRTWNCGQCAEGFQCNLQTNTCSCTAESDNDFCARLDKQCGAASGPDNCGTQRVIDECGPCSTGSSCSAAGQCVACTTTDAPATFCANAGKNCGSYTGPNSCGAQQTADCGTCTGAGEVCTNNVCAVPGAPLNDDCAGAEPLQFTAGSASVAGSTALATDNADGSCNSSSSTGKDVVYSFTIDPADAPLNLDAVLDSQNFDASIYLTRACPAAAGDEIECKDTPEEIHQERLAAGTYFIWIDGWSSGSGTYTLDVDLSTPPQAPANDLCAAPEALNFNGTDTASATGTTLGAGNDGTGTCATMAGGDVVYSFEITGTDNRSVTAVVTPDGTSTTYKPAVYILSADCATGTQVACGSTSTAGAAATAAALSLAPGVYYVLVDGLSSTEGGFSLSVQTGPERVLPDDCAAAEVIDLSSGSATVPVDTTLATNTGNGSCGGSSNLPDLVYSFTTQDVLNVEVRLTPGASGLDTVLYVRGGDCSAPTAADNLGCSDTTSAELVTLRRLPAGTYFVWVDGYSSGDVGPSTLQVTTSIPDPAPANDLCAGAIPLDFAGADTVSMTGTTANATNDSTGACGTMNGGDVVYSFTVPGTDPRMVTATVTRDSGSTSYSPAVYMRTDCADAATQFGCGTNSSGTATAKILSAAAGSTYYVIVDGTSASEGPFTLQLSLGTAVNLPDTCANAAPITFTNGTATVQGDTTLAGNDAYGCGSSSGSGRDLAYSFTIDAASAPMDVSASLSTAGSWDAVLYLTDACPAATTLQCSDPGTISKRALPAGTYYLWVDAYSSAAGAFTLNVSLTPTPPAPANDTCAAPAVLDLSSGVATVSGNTVSAANDYTGSCAGTTTATALSGGDAVYTFTLAADSSVSALVTPTSTGFVPAVYIRSADCTATADVACNRSTSANNAAILDLLSVPAGTYFLVVDGANSTGGAFDLRVATGAPRVLPDDCATAEALDFSNGPVLLTGDTSTATDSGRGTCGSSTATAKDLVYSFTIDPADAPKNLDVVIDTPSWDAVVYLATACPMTTPATEVLQCKDTPEELVYANLPAGTYYIWIDGYSTGAGAFSMRASLTAAPAHDTCAGAELVDFSTGAVTIEGSTRGVANDYSSSCDSTSNPAGPDVVYSFTIDPANAPMNFEAALDSINFDAVLYLTDSCAATTELQCNNTPETLSMPGLGAGTYYVWVDGYSTTNYGAFTLDMSLTAPLPNDTCATPEEILFSTDAVSGVSTGGVTGNTAGAYHENQGNCGGASKDLVYSFTTLTEQTVDVSLVPQTGATLKPVVYLRTGACDQASAEVPGACAAASDVGAATGLFLPRLPAGTYFVFVDGQTTTEGAFDLTVTTRDPPAAPLSDVCDGELLDLSSGSATVSGETYFAVNDYTGTCAAADGADLVYQVTLTQPQALTATVTPTADSPKLEPVVYLRSACASAAPTEELTCAAGAAGAAKSITVNTLQPGTYFLVVDAKNGSYGRFDLAVALAAPVTGPANESCAAPEVLTVDMAAVPPSVTVTGTTVNAQNELTGSCAATGAGDVVYELTTLTDHMITATVTPDATSGAGIDPAVYIRTNCSSLAPADQLVCNDANPAVAKIKNAPAGTYYVWVDGDSATGAGAFSLQVKLEDPFQLPAGDTCATAIPLTLATEVTGTTVDATDDYGNVTFPSVCDTPLYGTQDGEELVYSYTPTADGAFTITLTPTASDFDISMWVTAGACGDPTACAMGDDSGMGGEVETITIQGVANTTYFIVVDSYMRGEVGPFTLIVN